MKPKKKRRELFGRNKNSEARNQALKDMEPKQRQIFKNESLILQINKYSPLIISI